MELSIIIEYGWILLILIVLEGLLAADNALVLAIMVKHLPEKERKKALFYGLAGALIFRLGSLFIISFLVHVWQVQAIGALYLLFISFNYLFRKLFAAKSEKEAKVGREGVKEGVETQTQKHKGASFWLTVLKVEIVDIAFAVDSILAAVALAMALPETSLPQIGGLDGGKFLVIFVGGFIGVIIMRFAATIFVNLLQKRPGLEVAAFMIVGWVGVKLAVLALAHNDVALIPTSFAHSTLWKITFYTVLIAIALGGALFSTEKEAKGLSERQHSH